MRLLQSSSGGMALAKCKSGDTPKEVTLLYWMMVVAFAGVGFGWVTVRRRRKAAGPKSA